MEEIAEAINDFYHFTLFKDDETLSDIYGEEMCKQESRLLAQALTEKFAIKLPEEHEIEDWGAGEYWCNICETERCGYNFCLDEIKRLNRLGEK